MIWFMIIMIVALALIGVPMSFSMLTGSVWFMLSSGMPQTLMIQRLIMAVGDSFSMLAIPFFMLAGTIMNAGGVATRIFDFCNTLVGHIPGGLGHVNVFCSVIFAGMSGSALADTGGIGAIELKAMKDQGFDDDFSAAITGASSCLGPIIPPSTGMVLYAMMAEESVGTLIGVATKADMLDEEGRLPGIKPALMADAIGTTVGAVMGTSTITTFVESASGVAVGGRTGLTALTTGILFLASMFFAPIFTAIPSFATAPALMMVGYLMVSTVTEIRFDEDNMAEAIPAYLAIVAMPLFYSISEGISMGIISYVVLHVVSGKGKKVKPLMYVLAVLFVLKYIFL